MTRKKIFTLINQGEIHLSPEVKFLPKEEVGELLNGKELLDKIQEDAENYRKEVVLECEKLKENAQTEGYEEGFKNWVEHVAALEKEIVKVRQEFEKVLIPIALKAAKKIVGREIQLNEETIVDIIANALKPVVTHKKITIYVNKKDFEAVEKNKPRLKQLFESLEAFLVRERGDIEQGGCVIETEGGIINAQLENLWRILERAFDQLMKSKSMI